MNRIITFRGKMIHNGEWAFGDINQNRTEGKIYMQSSSSETLGGISCELWDVDPDTVGQFTGLKDKNGLDIYEGDIIRIETGMHYWEYVISTVAASKTNNLYAVLTFNNVSTNTEDSVYTYERNDYNKGQRSDLGFIVSPIKVIGNIHDNPELLK